MWFRLPKGTSGISVQNQEFSAEATDAEGNEYFRAPDHFAPLILDMPGFVSVGAPPGTDLPDLPKADPERDTAITRMTATVQSLEAERDTLLKENAELRERITVLEKGFAADAEAEVEGSKKK
jgi:hypothetical protein